MTSPSSLNIIALQPDRADTSVPAQALEGCAKKVEEEFIACGGLAEDITQALLDARSIVGAGVDAGAHNTFSLKQRNK